MFSMEENAVVLATGMNNPSPLPQKVHPSLFYQMCLHKTKPILPMYECIFIDHIQSIWKVHHFTIYTYIKKGTKVNNKTDT